MFLPMLLLALVGVAIVTIAAVVWYGPSMLRWAKHAPPGSGPEVLIGTKAEARTAIEPKGRVFADGALWNAVTDGHDPIAVGDIVIIESIEGLTLHVRRAEPPPRPLYLRKQPELTIED
jgi:membrane-bound serine protease (ClpP class)